MNQEKTGSLLKKLRKEKNLTQEELAEKLYVNSRSVSRWENGRTMPDFDILIELAKFYDISIEELLNGERTEEIMEKQTEKTLYDIAEYTNSEKERLLRNQHFFSLIGVACWIVFLGLQRTGKANDGGTIDKIASFAAGLAFGTSIISAIYSSRHINKIREFKKKLLKLQ